MRRKINHNNLAPWFLEDHGQLPASYLKSCQKFFDELQATSRKQGGPAQNEQEPVDRKPDLG